MLQIFQIRSHMKELLQNTISNYIASFTILSYQLPHPLAKMTNTNSVSDTGGGYFSSKNRFIKSGFKVSKVKNSNNKESEIQSRSLETSSNLPSLTYKKSIISSSFLTAQLKHFFATLQPAFFSSFFSKLKNKK